MPFECAVVAHYRPSNLLLRGIRMHGDFRPFVYWANRGNGSRLNGGSLVTCWLVRWMERHTCVQVYRDSDRDSDAAVFMAGCMERGVHWTVTTAHGTGQCKWLRSIAPCQRVQSTMLVFVVSSRQEIVGWTKLARLPLCGNRNLLLDYLRWADGVMRRVALFVFLSRIT